ncbi:MAG: TldD/PmbA family protein [Candidatus Bathyarchaeota archaeon]|nr:MAG: TldD/PmbA family protein [Candidatus Bathyarchaeota archaeon]
MEDLAEIAIQAALNAGASFVDIRIEETHKTKLEISDGVSKTSMGQLKGAGIRAFVDGAWAFAQSTEMTPAGMKRMGQHVALTALAIHDRVAEKFDMSGPAFQDVVSLKVKQKLQDVSLEEKMSLVRMVDDEVRAVDNRIVNTRTTYSDITTQLFISNSLGTRVWMANSLPLLLLRITAKESGVQQHSWGQMFGRGGFEIIDEMGAREIGQKAAKLAIDLLASKAAKGGTYDVIVDPQLNAAMVHEAFGHPCEADNWVAQTTVLEGMLGKQVGPEFLNLSDDPTISSWRGSFEYDWEGTKTLKRCLVKDGILTDLLHSLETAARMGMDPNGAARCQSFMFQPIPRMSNTLMERGEWNIDEMIADMRDGILLCDYNYGYTDSAKGQFMFQASYGYLIEKGEKTQMIRDVSLAGQILEFLNKIDAIGNDFGMSAGTCGKANQLVPDNSGGPHARIRQVPLGGM